jgi:hypothetical protein
MNSSTLASIYENRRNIAIHGVLLLLLVYVGRINELIPWLQSVPLAKIMFGMSAVLYLMSPDRNSLSDLMQIPLARKLLLLYLWAMVSGLFSIWPGGSRGVLIGPLLYNYVFMVLIALVCIRVDDLKKMGWGLAWALFALEVAFLLSKTEEGMRLSVSSTYDPNDLAFILVCFLPIIYYLMKQERGVKKAVLLAIILLGCVMLVRTESRGGSMGLFAVVAAGYYFKTRKVVKTLLLLGAVVGLFLVVSPASFQERMASLVDKSDYNYVADSGGRMAVWGRGLTMILKNPVAGVGIGAFEMAEGRSHTDEYGMSGKWSSAHNSFIQIAAEMGVVGLVLFILALKDAFMLLALPRHPDGTVREPDDLEWAAQGVKMSLIGYCVAGFFLSQSYSSVLYILYAMTLVIAYHRTHPVES